MPSPAPSRVVSADQLFLLALLTLIWGVNWPIMKLTVLEVPVLTFRTLCVAAGSLGCFAIARLAGNPVGVPKGAWPWLIRVSFFNVTCWNLLAVFGVTLMPSGRASILAFTMPLWAAAIGILWLNEPMTRRRAFGLACGLASLAILIGDDVRVFGEAPLGAMLMLGGAITWAIGTALMKKNRPAMPTSALTAWQMTLGGLPIALLALAFDPVPTFDVSPIAAFGVVYNMLACFVFCYWAWFRLVDTLPVAVSSMSTLMIPVVGTISGALILSESVGWQEFAALVLVVIALALILLPPRAKPAYAAGAAS